MSDPNTLGSLVRRRRLESGYSLGQLASKVGKTAAEVRAWERDAELPEHGILERLAETLELDLADIKELLEAGGKAGDGSTGAGEAADESDPSAEIVIDPEVPVFFPAETEAVPEEGVGQHEDPDEDGFAVEDPFTPPPPEDEPMDQGDGADGVPAAADDPDFDLFDAPTEAVPVPIITDTAAAARAERAVAVIEEPPPLPMVEPAPDSDPGLLRYLEPLRILFDPHNRYLYWIRAGLTVVVLLIFAVILMDQIGKLLDAISELLDTIEPAATPTDDLDALGWIGRQGL